MNDVPDSPTDITLRPATLDDVEAINAIYNHYVRTSVATFHAAEITPDERRAWLSERGPEHPVFVATLDDDVVGWGSLSRFRPREGWARTVENALYVRHDMHRRGIGAMMLVRQIELARAIGHHVIVASIEAQQLASIGLHVRHGFVEVGRFPEVGFKEGRWLDVVFMQLTL